MKSPTKQDFIEENQEEEVIEIERKIRVKILDPDATESSSDDEQEKKPKFIIHEIIQEKVKLQSFSLKSKNLSDFYQYSGKLPPMIRKRKCGKGAKNVRVKKEAISAKSENGSSSSDPPLMVPPMVRKRKCGKLEEKLKVAKNVIVKEAISANSENGSSSGSLPLMVDSSKGKIQSFSGKLPPMVRKRKSGKFATEIRNPFSKKRIWLGTFDTAEEASKVYQSKKFEFQEMLKNAKNANVKKAISAKFELGSSSFSNPPLMVDSQTSLNVLDDRLNKAINANVKKAISANFELGSSSSQTSDSSNELGDQFKKAKNANVKKAISAKCELGSSSSDPLLIVDEFDEQLKKAINANVKVGVSAKSELVSSSSSDPSSLVVDSQTSDSSNVVEEKDDQESEEEMWMGQWIQISSDKQVKFSQKLGVPVVDNYGFLLGEFSKLDDLSISI